ncbi:MAG TPA: ATP-binding cassette domain-containing protein [Candidatus Methanoperedens sp.]|nr:ATP-binding cassette domain-containing protein [Candidatus Methanoperedens sp.]
MSAPVLEVCDLSVSAGERPVLRHVSLTVLPGEVHVLLGPNGGGKTTLLMAIMGMPGYRVTGGRVLFRGEDVTGLGADERSRRGIALSFQRPPSVRGVTARTLVGQILARRGLAPETAGELAGSLQSEPLLDRDLNVGLSGGELKRSELLQLLALDPALALFDEPESGVDLDGIAVVGAGMRRLLGRGGEGSPGKAALIVTHTGHILREVPADHGHVLVRGAIVCRGEPRALFADVRAHGYEGCLICPKCLRQDAALAGRAGEG